MLAALGLAAAAIGAFVRIEARSPNPMLPLALFRRPAFAAPASLGMLANVAFYGLIFVLSLYFQQVRGYSALGAGVAFLPLTGTVLVANLSAGRLARLAGPRTVIMAGLLLRAAGCAGMLFVGRSTPFAATVAPQVALSGGLGVVVPLMTSALMGSVDRSRSGVASGTLNSARQAGSVLGVAIFGSLVARGHFIGGFHAALVASIGSRGRFATSSCRAAPYCPDPYPAEETDERASAARGVGDAAVQGGHLVRPRGIGGRAAGLSGLEFMRATLDAETGYTSIDITVNYLRPVTLDSGTLVATATSNCLIFPR